MSLHTTSGRVTGKFWTQENRCIILGNDPDDYHCDLRPVAGWSAEHQVEDQLHGLWKWVDKFWTRLSLNWHRNLLLRNQLSEMNINIAGLAVESVDVLTALRGKLWSWQTLCRMASGRAVDNSLSDSDSSIC